MPTAKTRRLHLRNGCRKSYGFVREYIVASSFEEFRGAPERCERCASGKQFAFLARKAEKAAQDEQASIEAGAAKWEPEADPEAWKARDDALIAARRAKRVACHA